MRVTVLGSGSSGNCTLIETETTSILVDAGLSARQILHRLQLIGRNIDLLNGIVLTHEHTDHTRALATLCRSKSLPVYSNRLTAEAITTSADWNERVKVSWRLFVTGGSFEIGDLIVDSFSVPHDAQDPVGFTIRHQLQAIAVLTDLGHATKLVVERVRGIDALVLEANHDLKLLQEDTARPWATKQRIMSRHGHLSNDAAGTLVREVCSDRLRHVFLAHLSRDCNRPDLAQRVVSHKLPTHVCVAVSTQDRPTTTVNL